MSPQDQARVVNALLANVENTPGLLNVRGGHEFARQFLERAKAKLARPVVIRHLGADAGRDRYEIGHEGDTRIVATRCRGVWATWWLLDDAGRSGGLQADCLTAPGATEPEASARKAIRVTAARQFEYWGMAQLRTAALACGIRGGVVAMALPCNAPRFITR